MSSEIANELFNSGRAHALSADLLFRASITYAEQESLPDPEKFAFNGTFSLSVHYLLGLGAELMLKAAYVACGGDSSDKHLRTAIGHDLVQALNTAESQGFVSNAPNLREILEHLRDPYLGHYFRYARPDEFPLPDVPGVIDAFEVLDEELKVLLQWE